MRNIKMIIQYDGTKYCGWQKVGNSKIPSIQEKMEETFTKYFGETIKINASGRTDKGVHALGQVINFPTESTVLCEEMKKELNDYLPEDISIIQCEVAHERFHARLNAQEKTYRYHVWIGSDKPLFQRKFVMIENEKPLNIGLMQRAATYLLGSHDFIGFSSDKTKKNTVRNLKVLDIIHTDNELIFEFTADGFLYNMVRIIVGTLIDIGKGELEANCIEKVFETKKREFAGKTVYPDGLFLVDVKY